MSNLLILYDGGLYQKIDGVAKGSPLVSNSGNFTLLLRANMIQRNSSSFLKDISTMS